MSQRQLLRKIYWTAGSLAVFVLAILVSVKFLNPTSVGSPRFVENINLWAASWAITFVIVLVLSFVLARDLIKLLFEYQEGKPGSRIKSKLVATFVIFSMFPALIMSLLAFGLINRNLQVWFTLPSEQLLNSSEIIVGEYYEQNRELSLLKLKLLAEQLPNFRSVGFEAYAEQLDQGRQQFRLGAAAIFDRERKERVRAGELVNSELGTGQLLTNVLGGDEQYVRRRLNEMELADVDLVTLGIPLRNSSGEVEAALVGQLQNPRSVGFHAIQVDEARSRYEELKGSVAQLELNYYSALALTTLALVFGFVWLGAYIARKITVPFEALATGASELAQGNLDHRVEVQAVDELGILVDSFNRMAEEIKQSRLELERANQELLATNQELDERRKYTETVLQNIATGVISLDTNGVIRTANQAAAGMLQTPTEALLNRSVDEVVGPELQAELEKVRHRASVYGTFRKNITFNRGDHTLFIAATATANPLPVKDEVEYLIVLDDLTELIKAEKFAAWQEVARRLAHEIKNPLTPIQLSVERMSRWYERVPGPHAEELQRFGEVFADSIRIIEAEAEMLKTLVDEFSRFARLPMSRPVETSLHRVIDQTLSLYDGGTKTVEIVKDFDPGIGDVRIDAEQMKRVLVNLIDNALDALSESEERKIVISTRLNRDRNSVTIEFSDTGAGIDPADYDNLFLPYFSTKKKGTGLGLAIVRQIVSEHSGYIRAEPNFPRGTKFSMDIPLS